MDCYRELYYMLFNRITDALAQLQAQNYGTASAILIQAQQEAEEQYLSAATLDSK